MLMEGVDPPRASVSVFRRRVQLRQQLNRESSRGDMRWETCRSSA
jgi:hypothetical protein